MRGIGLSSGQRLADKLARRLLEVLPRVERLSRVEHRFIALLAALNQLLEEEGAGRIIVVGGFAVELLVGGAFRTLDVDIVVEGYEAFKAFEELLRRIPRIVSESELSSRGPVLSLGEAEKAIDLLGSTYRPRFPPLRVEVEGFGSVYVEAPEELVLRYLREWAYWDTREARARVLLLLGVLGDKIDVKAILKAAREEDEKMARLLKQAVRLLKEHGIPISNVEL